MTRDEFVGVFSPLVVTLRADFDQVIWKAYYRALEDIPLGLLAAAVKRAIKSDRFMPKPGEIRQYADDARTAILAAHPFHACPNCSQQGWVEREIDGIKRMVHCSCWRAHRERLAELGIDPTTLLLLRPESDDLEAG